MLFVSYIIFSIQYTSIAILFFLVYITFDLPIEINPFIEMGGTEKYGKLIVHCMYIFAFALGIFPIIQLIPKINVTTTQLPQLEGLTLGNVTIFFKTTIFDPIYQMPIGTFSNYYNVITTFILYTFIAVILILLLHNRIKDQKTKDLNRLEGMILYIDFFNTDGPVNRERNQYLLYLYEKISNLHEWPIKKIFIVELLFSVLLLFISSIFGKF